MAESAQSLARRGLISTGAMNATLAKTRVQKSKMADFDGKQKDEAERNSRGHALGKNAHINSKETQRDRARSMPSKGARVNASYVPGREQIDGFPPGQRKTFPAGAGIVSKGAAGKNTRMKGRIPRSGGPYGGGGQNMQ